VPSAFLSLRKNLPTEQISMKFAASNRLNDYILGEIGTGTRQQDTTENSNRRQPVFCRDVKQMLAPNE